MLPLLKLEQAFFSISANDAIIKGIDAHIYPSDFVVVLGGNGSGKSTLIKLINQVYKHTQGEIYFRDEKLQAHKNKFLKKEIVTISQFISDSIFVDLTIEENAILLEDSLNGGIKKLFNKKRFLSELPDYLKTFNEKLSVSLKTQVRYLSGGEQQILAFALYLRYQPALLLLDEHTSALDPKKSDAVMAFTDKMVKEKNITCLMTTHKLDYALKYGNRLVAIRDGKFVLDVRGKEKEKLTMADLLDICY